MATKSLKLRICIASALLCTCYVNGVAENTNINDMSNMEGQRVETNPHIEHSWMDTTDIGIGFSQGQESHSYFSDYSTVTPVTHIPNGHVYRNEQSKGHNSKSPEIFAETLQPLTKYDENSKSIVFVQGKIAANGGTKYTLHRYRAHAAGGGSAFNTDDTYTEDNLGTTASIGVGYRLLSPSEHSYVGVNAFYDRAFKNSHSRISGGVEYVVGQNTVYANIYRSISGQKNPEPSHTVSLRIPSLSSNELAVGADPSFSTVAYERVANGYDIGYNRTFTNARWANVYVEKYHWQMKEADDSSFVNGFLWNYDVRLNYLKKHKDNISGIRVGSKLQMTPHISLELGYDKINHRSGTPYVQVLYTLGKAKYAYFGGKHGDSRVTSARSKMLDKVHRKDIVVDRTEQESLLFYAQPNQL